MWTISSVYCGCLVSDSSNDPHLAETGKTLRDLLIRQRKKIMENNVFDNPGHHHWGEATLAWMKKGDNSSAMVHKWQMLMTGFNLLQSTHTKTCAKGCPKYLVSYLEYVHVCTYFISNGMNLCFTFWVVYQTYWNIALGPNMKLTTLPIMAMMLIMLIIYTQLYNACP